MSSCGSLLPEQQRLILNDTRAGRVLLRGSRALTSYGCSPEVEAVVELHAVDSGLLEEPTPQLHRSLQDGMDFIMVSPATWAALHDHFGGGPAIQRYKSVVEDLIHYLLIE